MYLCQFNICTDWLKLLQIITGMSGQNRIDYQQFKYCLQNMQNSSVRDKNLLLSQLSRVEEQSHYYEQRYLEMKSINQSIIEAIKRVFSQEVGEQLQRIIEQQQTAFNDSRRNINFADLTNTFCQKIKTYSSKLYSQQSVDLRAAKLSTPKKSDIQSSQQYLDSRKQSVLSPFLFKSNTKKRCLGDSSFKLDSGEISTRRSCTPIRAQVATQIYCELCQKVFPPNEFVGHAEMCKYELDLGVKDENFLHNNNVSNFIDNNYSKMMRNLLKIREEIEQQINLISVSKEEIDRAKIKRKLQKDLKTVIKVINEKQQQIKRKKCSSTGSSLVKGGKKMNKIK